MKKVVIGVAGLALLASAVAFAPRVRAQDHVPTLSTMRARAQTSLPDVLTLHGAGSSIGVTVNDRANDGVVVVTVRESGPAARAGLRAGDRIVDFDGERVRSTRQFVRLVRETPPTHTVKATIVRDGARRTIELKPEAGRVTLEGLSDIARRIEQSLRALCTKYGWSWT